MNVTSRAYLSSLLFWVCWHQFFRSSLKNKLEVAGIEPRTSLSQGHCSTFGVHLLKVWLVEKDLLVKVDQFKIRQIWLRPVSSGKHENIFKQSLREKNLCLFCSEIIVLSSVLMSFKLETSGKQKHSFFIQDDSTDTLDFEAFDWEWSDKERLLLILFYCRRRRLKMLLENFWFTRSCSAFSFERSMTDMH